MLKRKHHFWCGHVRAEHNLMLTYTKTITETKPRLVIEYDENAESPRTFDGGNVGHFFTKESRYKSPDGNVHPLYQIMVETEDEAKDTLNGVEGIAGKYQVRKVRVNAKNPYDRTDVTELT